MANTATQLAQYALNIAVPYQQQLLSGQAEISKGGLVTMLGAMVALAEAVIAINSSNTGGPAVLPGSLTSGKYSVTQPSTSLIQT